MRADDLHVLGRRWRFALPLGALLVTATGSLFAQGEADLGVRLARLEQRVGRLEAATFDEHLSALVEAEAAWDDTLVVREEDRRFELRIGGRLQSDWTFARGDDLEDGTEFRRARLTLSGRLYHDVDFQLGAEFAGGVAAELKSAFIGFRNVPVVGRVRVGVFREPLGLEANTSTNFLTFLERATPAALAPGRNTGVMVFDTALDERLTWAIGAFRETDDFGNSAPAEDGHYGVTARLTGLPLRNADDTRLLHLGIGIGYKNPAGGEVRFDSRPEVHQLPRFVDTGRVAADRLVLGGLELAVVLDELSLQAELIGALVESDDAGDPLLWGAYVQASWFATGESRAFAASRAAFDRTSPRRPLEAGGPGAFELAARFSHLDLDDGAVSGGRLSTWTLAVNWYLNDHTRIAVDYVQARATAIDTAHVVAIRLQIDF